MLVFGVVVLGVIFGLDDFFGAFSFVLGSAFLLLLVVLVVVFVFVVGFVEVEEDEDSGVFPLTPRLAVFVGVGFGRMVGRLTSAAAAAFGGALEGAEGPGLRTEVFAFTAGRFVLGGIMEEKGRLQA